MDFQDDEEDHEATGVRDEHVHPQQEEPPALLLEDVPRFIIYVKIYIIKLQDIILD